MQNQFQIDRIVDKLVGRELGIVRPGDLDEPWWTIYRRVRPVDDLHQAEAELWKATVGLKDRSALAEAVLLALPDSQELRSHPSLADVAEDLPPVDWLWPGWIPRGMLTLLGAAPGAGKSLLALDLARRIIHDRPFPDGAPSLGCSGNIVYVDAEAVPQIKNEQALAWGMDRSRLYLLLPPEVYGMIDLGQVAHQDRLLEMVSDLKPELVVVDSLSSITVKGENNVEDVRQVLGFLTALAREYRLGLLLIHHLRKRAKGASPTAPITIDDFRGSGHIVAMARSVIAMSIIQTGPEPDQSGPRRLQVAKTNLCPSPPPLGITFEETGAGAPLLHYGQSPTPYRRPTQVDRCADWLQTTLHEAGQPLKPRDLLALARDAGFTRGIVYAARKRLEGIIVDTDRKMSPDNAWTLSGED
jgi:hypothetical protein